MIAFSRALCVLSSSAASVACDQRGALQIGEDLPRQFVHRGHNIRQPGVNRAARHAVEFGRRRLLHQHHARLFLDGAQAQRAVGAHARKNHADAVLLLVLRQGAEEKINRQAQPARRRRFEQMQDAVQDGHVLVRRDHIDAVRLDQGAILDLDHFHAGGALEQFGHDAFARRVQMLDDDKSHAAVLRHVRQKMFQSLQVRRPRRRCRRWGTKHSRARRGFPGEQLGPAFSVGVTVKISFSCAYFLRCQNRVGSVGATLPNGDANDPTSGPFDSTENSFP